MEWIKKNAKAVATFIVTILAQAVTDAFAGTATFDLLDWQGWLRYLGLSLVAGVVVWATGNKLDLSQILAGTRKLPVPQQAEVAQETLTHLPDKVSDNVVAGYPNWANG